MLGNPLLLSDDGYNISRSVRLRSSASAYFNRTPASASNRKTWTWSGWVKRGGLPTSGYYSFFGADSGSGQSFYIAFDNSTQQLELGQGATVNRKTTQVFRDPSAWYHIVIASDTTQATGSNRLKIYVNGNQVTTFATSNDPSLNGDWAVNNNVAHSIGADITNTGARNYLDGYLTEVNFIDGQALTPSSFGETDAVTGVWKPKKYAGTYGTNGFYLNFSDNSNNTATTIGKDYSGNGNNWTPNNISVTSGSTYDSMLDVPTMWADGGNGRGNYCTLNPLDGGILGGGSFNAPTNGNLDWTGNSSGDSNIKATIAVSSGKWYAEFTNLASAAIPCVVTTTTSNTANSYPNQAGGYGYLSSGQKANNATYTSYGATFTSSDVIGVALDLDAGTLTFYKNGTSQGQAFSGLSGLFTFGISDTTNAAITANANFGQRPFAYTPPTGFRALNTQNLPAPTILKGNQWFNAVTWTGDGVDGRTITGVGFNPDLVWAKGRSNTGAHVLADAVRGTNANLYTNLTDAETNPTTGASGGGIGSVTTDGFVLEQGTTNMDLVNTSSRTYVGWAWKESATAGFDIVTYTGNGTNNRTVSHSLGVTPSMVIVKSRSSGIRSWFVAHRSLATNNNLLLQSSDIAYGPSAFGSGVVGNLTSTVFECVPGTISPNNTANINANGENFVAYLFAEVAGFSKFGSYVGNGSSTDGPFVFCGFKPRFILTKNITTSGYWWEIVDSAREPVNPSDQTLYANVSDSEYTSSTYNKDLLSNGFKIRGNSAGHNASGDTYIYAAFAEHPFKNALAR